MTFLYCRTYCKLIIHTLRINNFVLWMMRGFSSPSPDFIKRAILKKYSIPTTSWIETGTYLGNTTKYLARFSPQIISIEPSFNYFNFSKKRLGRKSNIKIIHGTSEEKLLSAMNLIQGDINFWLDGHNSGGDTYMSSQTTPIIEELIMISKELENSNRKICIFIDDFRLFNLTNSEKKEYPDLRLIVDWANEHLFQMSIEHDIIILHRTNLDKKYINAK